MWDGIDETGSRFNSGKIKIGEWLASLHRRMTLNREPVHSFLIGMIYAKVIDRECIVVF